MPVDIRPATDAIGKLQVGFATPNVDTNQGLLQELRHHGRVLLSVIEQCLQEIDANDPLNPDVLDLAALVYNLSAYTPAQIEAFKNTQKLALQQEYDNSTHDGYTVVKIGLDNTGQPAGSFLLQAFLSPKAIPGGGGTGGNGTPGYPPK
jgi:hypothetical protein